MKIKMVVFLLAIIAICIGSCYESNLTIFVSCMVAPLVLFIPIKVKKASVSFFESEALLPSLGDSDDKTCSVCGELFSLTRPEEGFGTCKFCAEKQSIIIRKKRQSPVEDIRPSYEDWA